jgi:hypothetical protein
MGSPGAVMGALLTLPANDTGGLLVLWKKTNFPALGGPVVWSPVVT